MGSSPGSIPSGPTLDYWNGVGMKLTRLRLLGFKSFVEPTDFMIEPGLTGVVGPNGCGKSNLVEALRWVMGETSHKSLRAADMDDVIFSGTNQRPGRNNAEVGIQIDNSARKAPAQFNEHNTLDVSRRIERDSGSTYRINGREVRARDVQILFADASTGARSPALVHQGRIGEIIQAKPEQRRRVLEEAAGIAGLHARRHEAELQAARGGAKPAAARGRGRAARELRWMRSRSRRGRRSVIARWRRRCARPRPRCSICAGSPPMPSSAPPSRPGTRPVSRGRGTHRRAGRGIEGTRRWPQPSCRRCARPRPGPPPHCSA